MYHIRSGTILGKVIIKNSIKYMITNSETIRKVLIIDKYLETRRKTCTSRLSILLKDSFMWQIYLLLVDTNLRTRVLS